ncbi:MAG: bifunctional oligoribonuclease/PAP phosphatase NrnA, partial [Anaerolineae bacterium]
MMTTQSDQVQRAAGLLDSASRIAIACHLGPDPDAIGSLLGLGLAMQERGKTVHLLTDGPIPRSVQWLPSVDQIRLKPLTDEPVDLFVALDSSDPERLGEVGQPLIANDELTTLVIDHHATNTEFGDVNLITVEAAATAEQIVYVLDALQH